MILIKNATAVEFDPPRIRPDVNLVIDGDTIVNVGKGVQPSGASDDVDVIDARGGLVYPGIVCSHHHYYSGLARGILAKIGPTPDFMSILKNLWWRLDRAADEENLNAAAMVCNLDAIRAGTTAVIDHHASPNFIAGSLSVLRRAFEKSGVRGATCYEVTDRHGEEDMLAGIEENISFAKAIAADRKAGSWSGLVESYIGGHAPVTLPDSALRALADAIASTGRGLHLHVAEGRYDVSHSHLTYGKDIVPRLDDFGLLDEKTILVHGVYLNEEEIAILNERDAFLVHNCRSNMNNNVGYNTRLPLYKNLALGTDGIGGDMFTEVKHAFFKHKDAGGAWWPGDYLKALSAGNRILERAFGRRFGRVEAGFAADLVIADYDPPTPFVPENIAGHFVFGMDASITRSVIINGNVVYRDREFPFDTKPIYADAREQAQRLWNRMDEIAP